MSSWNRSSYSAPSAATASDGWQTVAPRATRTWGSASTPAAGGPGHRAWPSSSAGAGGGDMPSAFMKKPRGDDRPRRQTEEEVRRDYAMKLAAEKAVKEAAQAKHLADTEDNFPSLSVGAVTAKSKPKAVPAASWATQIKSASDENEQKRRAAAEAEATNKLSEGITVLRIGSRKEMREPFFTTGTIEKEADFHNNEALRRACFSSSIIAEQEKYDYNRATGYGEDDLDEAPPGRAYSPHSPPYSPTCYEEDEE